MKRARHTRKGFTIIEVMIAAAILVIGFAAVIALLAQSNSVHRHSVDISQASMLADDIFEDIAIAYDTRWRDGSASGRGSNGIPDVLEAGDTVVLGADYPQREGFTYEIMYRQRGQNEANFPRDATQPSAANRREMLVSITIRWMEPSGEKELKADRVVLLRGTSRPNQR